MAYDPQKYNEILTLQSHIHELQYDYWLKNELFTHQWWALVGVLIIPWIIWWKLVDKRNIAIILAYGLYMMLIITAMDATGSVLHLWIYPITLLPIISNSISIDLGLLTVLQMLIYQYFPRWKAFILAESVFSALLAFIGEPFAEWYGIYLVLHWYHTWSFPIYILKAIVGKWLIEKIILP